jgi:hypothetical protein
MEDYEKGKAFRNGGKVFHEPYSEDRLNALKRLIEKLQSQQRKKRYSILVDGEMIVHNSYDPVLFDDYLDYVEPHTNTVEVRMYFGDSPNANRYLFHLKEQPTNGLNGFKGGKENVNDLIAEALEKQSMESELVQLRRKYKKTKRRLKEAEQLLEEKQVDVKDLLSHGMQLYGAFQGKTPIPSTVQGLPTTEVEIEPELSEADEFYRELKEQVGEDKLISALKIWKIFAKHPEMRSEFLDIIQQNSEQDG